MAMRSLALAVVLLGCGAKPSLVGDGGAADAPTRASLSINPTSAELVVGGTPPVFTVTNTGLDTTGIIALQVIGTDSPDFAIANASCSVLTAGASCTVEVRLVPKKTGPLQAMLRASSESIETTAMLQTQGVDPGSGLTITSPGVAFAVTAVKNDSPPLAFTVTNLGALTTGPLVTTIDASNPQFIVADQGNTCADTALAPGDTCQVPVSFAPRGSGAVTRLGMLTVADQLAASATQTLSAKTGLIAAPSSTSVGPITGSACAAPMGSATISFTNETWTGTAMTVTLNGNDANQFGLVTDCAPTLASGATCMATVSPRATDALLTTTLSTSLVVMAMQANATFTLATPITTSLSQCDLQIVPGTLSFGAGAAGTNPPIRRSFSVSNAGAASYLLATALGGADPADFTVVTDTCNNTMLAPGATTCTVTLDFTPAALGQQSAEMAVTTPGLAPPPVLMSGTGIASGITATPETLALAGPVGMPASTKTVTISTTSSTPGPLGFSITPPFSVTPGAGCATLGPSNPCTATVGFTASGHPTVMGTLTITSAVGGDTVALTGTGQ